MPWTSYLFSKKKLGKIRTILAGYAGNERFLHLFISSEAAGSKSTVSIFPSVIV